MRSNEPVARRGGGCSLRTIRKSNDYPCEQLVPEQVRIVTIILASDPSRSKQVFDQPLAPRGRACRLGFRRLRLARARDFLRGAAQLRLRGGYGSAPHAPPPPRPARPPGAPPSSSSGGRPAPH